MPESPWGEPSSETIANLKAQSDGKPPVRRFVVVIIHYRNPQEVWELVESIGGWNEKPEAIVIADNSHPRDVWSGLSLPGIPINIASSPGNPGYGQAANLAIFSVNPEVPYVLLLTQDARLQENTARMLIDTIRSDPYAAVAGPALVYRSNEQKYFSLGGSLSARGETKHDGLGTLTSDGHLEKLKIKSVDWLDGACLLLRVDVFRALNGFDPSYFLYVEEVDYQLRVRLSHHKALINQQCIAAQEPGNYPWALRSKNHVRLTKKFKGHLRRWPIATIFLARTLKASVSWLTNK